MWMLIRNVLLAGCVVLWATPALCEYYQYTDPNGVLRFTDDLASVPPDQRPDIKTHQSVKSDSVQPKTGEAATGKTSPHKGSSEKGASPSATSWKGRNAQKKLELDQMQADLKKTFKALQAERSALESNAPPEGASFKQKVTYTNKVEALNAKIARYEEQLDVFNEKVNAYNTQAKK